jgi:hypothetical protein
MDSTEKPAEGGEEITALDKITLARAELKRGVATSIGSKIEDMLDGAEKKAHETGGAKKAMQAHAKNLLGIVAAVDAEVEKSIPDLPTAQLVKSWLNKCVVATENLAGHLGNVELQAHGEAAGYRAVHDYIQKMVREIDDGKTALARAIAEGRVVLEDDGSPQMVGDGPRLPGARPAPSISQQRRLEAQTQPEEPPKKKRGKKA